MCTMKAEVCFLAFLFGGYVKLNLGRNRLMNTKNGIIMKKYQLFIKWRISAVLIFALCACCLSVKAQSYGLVVGTSTRSTAD